MANGITTEWDDIHVKLGNYEELPTIITQGEIRIDNYDKMDNFDPLRNKNNEELDSLEDELEEEYLRMYKDQRAQEMKEVNKKPQYGYVQEISKNDYIQQVNNAPSDVWVVIHLYQSSIQQCLLINNLLERFAVQHKTVKFIKIVGDKCIEDFPDKNCPAFIFYRNGKMTSFLHRVDFMVKLTIDGLTELLQQQGVLGIQNTEDQEEYQKIQSFTKGKLDFNQKRDQEFSSSDDDREYENTKLKKFNFR